MIDEREIIVRQFSERGKKHCRTDTLCQDACGYCTSPDGFTVMAVADGVGSSLKSDEASKVAVKSICDFWEDYASPFVDESSMQCALRTALNYALAQVQSLRTAQTPPFAFETTLEVAVVTRDGQLFFAHAGDGAIWGITADGKVYLQTERLRDSESGHVFCLGSGVSHWIFGAARQTVQRAMIVTDGVNDVLLNKWCRQKELVGSLASKKLMSFTGEEAFRKTKTYYERLFHSQTGHPFAEIDDDITVSVAFIKSRTSSPSAKDSEDDNDVKNSGDVRNDGATGNKRASKTIVLKDQDDNPPSAGANTDADAAQWVKHKIYSLQKKGRKKDA